MDFKQIQYFLCLFEEGSVTRAAKRLNIVQPALSMQLSRMEHEIGHKLFERKAKGIVATAAGRFLHAQFVPIMKDVAEAMAKAASLNGRLFGKVEIGMLSSLAASVLAPAVQQFLSQSPDVEIIVKEGYSGNLIEEVSTGQLDAALVNSIRGRSGLVVQPVLDERLCAVLGAHSSIRPKGPLTLAQIAGMKLILPTSQNGLRTLIDSQAQAQGVIFKPRVAVDGLLPLIDVVQRYDGVTLLPPLSAFGGLRSGMLSAFPLAKPYLQRSLVWVHHPRRPFTAATRIFIDFVNKQIDIAARTLDEFVNRTGKRRKAPFSQAKAPIDQLVDTTGG
jgi:DNA-binding transcriptional LysR family regulator